MLNPAFSPRAELAQQAAYPSAVTEPIEICHHGWTPADVQRYSNHILDGRVDETRIRMLLGHLSWEMGNKSREVLAKAISDRAEGPISPESILEHLQRLYAPMLDVQRTGTD